MTTNKCIKILALVAILTPGLALAAVKKYQVTGKVLEVTPTSIVVQKDEEKWEVARDANTKVEGDLKVGSKVTIQYRCIATDVEVKAEKKK